MARWEKVGTRCSAGPLSSRDIIHCVSLLVAIHFLSRSKLTDLFLPTSLQEVGGGSASSEELVQITQLVEQHHHHESTMEDAPTVTKSAN